MITSVKRKEEHEKLRKKVWADAWCATASAWNCKDTTAAARWADAALKDFDERFKS